MDTESLRKKMNLSPGFCGFDGKLAYHETFRLFMDLASEHADLLGIGMKQMQARGLFWLTVKTKMRFLSRPKLGEPVCIATWPQAPQRSRGDRSYELRDARGNLMIAGKTEWAVIDLSTKRVTPLGEIYPASLRFDIPPALEEPFGRFRDDFSESECFARYRIRSTDIDLGGHMNNAAYVRAVLGAFESTRLLEMNIRDLEVIYRAQSFEGEELIFERQPAEGGILLRASHEGETRMLMKITQNSQAPAQSHFPAEPE